METAKADHCQTIVVGRESFSGLKRFFQHHIVTKGGNGTLKCCGAEMQQK